MKNKILIQAIVCIQIVSYIFLYDFILFAIESMNITIKNNITWGITIRYLSYILMIIIAFATNIYFLSKSNYKLVFYFALYLLFILFVLFQYYSFYPHRILVFIMCSLVIYLMPIFIARISIIKKYLSVKKDIR